MSVRTGFAPWSIPCGCAVALASCSYNRPPQTGFYCIDIPEGRSTEATRFVKSVADRLGFKISEAQFPGFMDKGPPDHVWEVYGKGVSMFVQTAMKDSKPDRFGNVQTTFNPNRLTFNVAKTGWWQRVRFQDVVIAARDSARQFEWPFSKAAPGQACGTRE